MATTSKSLATMSATERLQFYREAAKQARPAKEASTTLAERVAIIGARTANFGTDVKAAYAFHRYQ